MDYSKTFVKEPTLFPYCFVLTLFTLSICCSLCVAQGRTGPQWSVFYGSMSHQWFPISVCLAITERRWDSHVLPCVKRNPVRASSWGYSSHCCPDSCLVNDFAVFPGKSHHGFHAGALCVVLSRGLKVTQGQDSIEVWYVLYAWRLYHTFMTL